ncbi:MAG: NAD(P)H-dependent oxidoreductase subunit E [bacterium]|nr:NAD(P)H-dependent oxidoreductase subunit E [bacterium]
MNIEIVEKILEKHRKQGDGLISILEEIQSRFTYLPEEALRMVASERNIPLVNVYGVATFYRAFSLKPRGKHLICGCLGTACHVRGGPVIVEELEKNLGVKRGETTPDKEFTLETVACLGACALGPVVVADGKYFPKVRKTKVKNILEQVRKGFEDSSVEQDYHIFPVEVSCPNCNHSLMNPNHIIDHYPSIRFIASFDQKHGWIELSSMYGSYKVFTEHEIPSDTIVHFFCTHCHAELTGSSPCPACNAPMASMIVRGGGIIQICSRQGCRSHMLDLG